MLAGPYRTIEEAQAVFETALHWARRASGDPVAGTYRYAISSSFQGPSQSISRRFARRHSEGSPNSMVMRLLPTCGLRSRTLRDGSTMKRAMRPMSMFGAFMAASPAWEWRRSANLTNGNTLRRSTQGSRGNGMADDAFWSNPFQACALATGFIAAAEGQLDDSRCGRNLADGMFEDGACADHVSVVRARDRAFEL